MNKKKKNLSGAFAVILALLILAIFIPINMIFSYYDKVYDATPSGKYTLDPLTSQILDDYADKEIEIYFLNSLFNLKSEPMALPVYHTLMELDKRDNITLICFDPNKDTEMAEKLNPNGLFELQRSDIFVKCGDIIRQVSREHFFQQDSQGILEYTGENLITGAISVCVSGNLPTVYFLSGYGNDPFERTLEDGSVIMDDCYSLYKDELRMNNYDVKELDLSTVDRLPDDAVIVYLAGPKTDISASDRDKLADYLDNGGAISMFLPPCETEGRFENIEFLLAKFELEMDYNIISEGKKEWMLENLESDKDANYFLVTYPARGEDYAEDLTTDINTLIQSDAQKSNLLYKKWGISNARSFEELTSSGGMIEKARIIENLPTAADTYEYTVVSKAMGGDDKTKAGAVKLSEQSVGLGYYSYNKQTGAKLIVIGSDDMITDERVTEGVKCTRMLAKFTNTWLFDSDIDMGITSKFNSYDTMVFESGKEASRAINLFILVPIIVGLAGVAVWLKRRYA